MKLVKDLATSCCLLFYCGALTCWLVTNLPLAACSEDQNDSSAENSVLGALEFFSVDEDSEDSEDDPVLKFTGDTEKPLLDIQRILNSPVANVALIPLQRQYYDLKRWLRMTRSNNALLASIILTFISIILSLIIYYIVFIRTRNKTYYLARQKRMITSTRAARLRDDHTNAQKVLNEKGTLNELDRVENGQIKDFFFDFAEPEERENLVQQFDDDVPVSNRFFEHNTSIELVDDSYAYDLGAVKAKLIKNDKLKTLEPGDPFRQLMNTVQAAEIDDEEYNAVHTGGRVH